MRVKEESLICEPNTTCKKYNLQQQKQKEKKKQTERWWLVYQYFRLHRLMLMADKPCEARSFQRKPTYVPGRSTTSPGALSNRSSSLAFPLLLAIKALIYSIPALAPVFWELVFDTDTVASVGRACVRFANTICFWWQNQRSRDSVRDRNLLMHYVPE